MYNKILRWQKSHLNKPLETSIVAACVFATKSNPEDYYSEIWETPKEKFIQECSKKNHLVEKKEALSDKFFANTGIKVSELVESDVWHEIMEMDSINDYLASKSFTSRDEIKLLCKKIFNEYLNDPAFLDSKQIIKIYKQRGYMYVKQMDALCRGIDNVEKWADGTANQFWFGVNAIKCITERFNKLMDVPQSEEAYFKAVIDMKDAFNFSDLQIEMLKYAICQSKEGNCPASLNKAVYIWGAGKGTGKTTIAATIVSILNGEKDISNIRQYKSNLPQELGFTDHVAPLICSSRAVLLDEAMPKDSSKSYDTFKDRITSDGAKIRFVYKNQIDVQAKANYWLSSNHPLSTFIQDKSERRFLEFEIEKKHKNLTYKEIYDIFLNFIQQCKRTKEWQDWYDDLAIDTEVKGIESLNADDIVSYFNTDAFLREVAAAGSQISIGTFYFFVNRFENGVKKTLIRECVTKIFGEPYRPSMWKKSDVLDILKKIRTENDLPEIYVEDDDPF